MNEANGTKPKAPKGFIVKGDASKILGCTRRTVDNMMYRRLIPFYKFGRRVYFKEADLIKAVEATLVKTEAETPPAAIPEKYDDVVTLWTDICKMLRFIENGQDSKHARLAKDCLAHIGKFI